MPQRSSSSRRPARARPARRRPKAAGTASGTAARGAAATPDRLRIGRVYDAPSPGDGARVLVMRKWPRGVRKERVDLWLRELGPEEDLMHAFLGGRVAWPDYRVRYLAGLERPAARPALDEVGRLVERGPVTLLCWCQDPERCHRSLLRGFLAERLV